MYITLCQEENSQRYTAVSMLLPWAVLSQEHTTARFCDSLAQVCVAVPVGPVVPLGTLPLFCHHLVLLCPLRHLAKLRSSGPLVSIEPTGLFEPWRTHESSLGLLTYANLSVVSTCRGPFAEKRAWPYTPHGLPALGLLLLGWCRWRSMSRQLENKHI